MRYLVFLTCFLFACSSAPPSGIGGSGGAVTNTSEGGAGGSPVTVTPAPWEGGYTEFCTLVEPFTGGPQENNALALQRVVPAGGWPRQVDGFRFAVAKDATFGGPYTAAWLVAPANATQATFPKVPRVYGEKVFEEKDIQFTLAGGFVGQVEVKLDLPVILLDGEAIWAGERVQLHAPRPSSIVVCSDNAISYKDAFFSNVTNGAVQPCPGACDLEPLADSPEPGKGPKHAWWVQAWGQ